MADKIVIDVAFVQAVGTLATARGLAPHVSDRENARTLYATALQIAHKLSEEHGFALKPKSKPAETSLRS